MKTFEVGKVYSCKSDINSMVFHYRRVISRTNKTVTVEHLNGDGKRRCKIYYDTEGEYIRPFGVPSPVLRA
jgi:hypothetical protein